jgi:RNA polymerase sigma factor (TIGR02999 family)
MNDLTEILNVINRDAGEAPENLLPLVYDELRRLAAARMAQEKPGQTLQATALVHEAWLRLLGSGRTEWDGRGHFFAAAAEAMRRILIENARRKKRLKHGAGQEHLDLDSLELACGMPGEDLLALDEALAELETMDPVGAQIVKLRFFAGLNHPQIAAELGLSLTAVERNWSFCRTWLFRQIQSPK